MMALRLVWIAILLLACCFGSAWPQDQPTAPTGQALECVCLPVLGVGWCQDPPQVDGRPVDRCWREAAAAELAHRVGGGEPEQKAYALLTCDDRMLYVCARLTEPAPPKTRFIRQDGDFSEEDTFEVLLDAGVGSVFYYRFLVNPSNSRLDERCLMATGISDKTWNGEWKSATFVDNQAWFAELAIPWTDLKLYFRPGDVIGLNVCWKRATARERITWSPTQAGFDEPERLGAIALAADLYQRHPGIRTDAVLWDPDKGLNIRFVVWDTSAMGERVRLSHRLLLPGGRTENMVRMATVDLDVELHYNWGPVKVDPAGPVRLMVIAEKESRTRSVLVAAFVVPKKE